MLLTMCHKHCMVVCMLIIGPCITCFIYLNICGENLVKFDNLSCIWLAYTLQPFALKWTKSFLNMAGSWGHISKVETSSPSVARCCKYMFTRLMFFKTSLFFLRGGILLSMMDARGHRCWISPIRLSYCFVTSLDGCNSASFPPHCSTTRRCWLSHGSRCGMRLRISGILEPAYI